jgi:enoyl-CoA hydratase/carnithine racemase
MPELLTERIDRTVLITLNRPERLNAFTADLTHAYLDALQDAANDPAVRAIVVTGSGQAFCAGGDISQLEHLTSRGLEADRDPRGQLYALSVPKPVIAAVNGVCAGLGMVHALACDIRLAGEAARFTTAFSKRGLVAEDGMSWLLPQIAGRGVALDLLLTARTVDAREARSLRLVSDVLPDDSLVPRAVELGNRLAAEVAPASMKVIKQQVTAHAVASLADAVEESRTLMAHALDSDDFREGVASFIARRPPEFRPV